MKVRDERGHSRRQKAELCLSASFIPQQTSVGHAFVYSALGPTEMI